MGRMTVFTNDRRASHRFIAHEGGVLSLATSRDGEQVASGGADGYLRVWSARHARCDLLYEIDLARQCPPALGSVLLGPYASVSHNMSIPSLVTAVEYSPLGKRLLAACGGYLFVIGLTGRTILRRSDAQPGQVLSAAWAGRRDRFILSACCDGYFREWRGDTGKRMQQHSRSIMPMHLPRTVVPDIFGWSYAAGGTHGACVFVPGNHPASVLTDGPVEAVGWAMNGKSVFVGDRQGNIRQVDTGALDISPTRSVHAGSPIRCMAKPYSSLCGATGDEQGVVKVWHEEAGPYATLVGHAGPVRCVAAPPHFNEVYSGGDDGTIRRWADLDQDRRKMRGHSDKITSPGPAAGERHLDI